MPWGIEPQRVKCQAKRSNGKDHCGAWAVRGRRVCRVHGGMSPAPGPGHPAYKHGRYSKVVPREIAGLYHSGLADPNILEMTDELAILGARTGQLMERARLGESEVRWTAVQEAMRAVLSFDAQGDSENLSEAIAELSKVVFAKTDHEGWREVLSVIDLRRKIASVERARLQAAQQTVTVSQLLGFAGAISGIINSRISDPVTRSEIADDIRRLLTREGHTAELPAVEEG
jgi:hypothetical protein